MPGGSMDAIISCSPGGMPLACGAAPWAMSGGIICAISSLKPPAMPAIPLSCDAPSWAISPMPGGIICAILLPLLK